MPGSGCASRRSSRCARDGTYLVTGGISGFGFAAARWLAAHGAGSIALLGRRGGDTPGAGERVAELRALGAEVRIYAGDVADPASLAAVLDEIRPRPAAAARRRARRLGDRRRARRRARRRRDSPTSCGRSSAARSLLDRLTRDDPIELFLLFSSATTLLGAPGQGVYVAANLALEALARRRRAEGRPALAVAWGPIEDAGYLAERPETRDALARRLGAKPMPAAQALAGAAGDASTAARRWPRFAETSWNEARRFLPILAAPLFAEIRADEPARSPGDDSLIERLAGLDPDEALALLKTVVAEEAANILRLPAGRDRPAAAAVGDGHGFADGGRAAPGARKPAAGRSAADVARRGHQRRLDRDAARQRRRGAAAGRRAARAWPSATRRRTTSGWPRSPKPPSRFDPIEIKSAAAE